jgi:hypothetical protein
LVADRNVDFAPVRFPFPQLLALAWLQSLLSKKRQIEQNVAGGTELL